jgi:hypothetical protein
MAGVILMERGRVKEIDGGYGFVGSRTTGIEDLEFER